ncbi:unnamed protein product [Meganyctiphanes norvegica]|uniref:sn-1-specific diacylglycerol lipase n=1 Tax=Meganyctiphanes norvegica TaxID=48144 RepID=A0AAV2QJW3_MEGNR
MPALVVFNRRWRIGSDDLVIPGVVEVVIRTAWFALLIALFASHEANLDQCDDGSHLLRLFLLGSMIILGTTLIITIVLVIHSSRGTIMNPSPRSGVPKLIIARVMLGVPEIAWSILGSVWVLSGMVDCEDESVIPVLIKSLIIYTWVAIGCIVVGILLLFDPMMRPDSAIDIIDDTFILDPDTLGTNYVQLWEKRCRFLCFCTSGDEHSSEAFSDVADVLASLFESSDHHLVASDVAAALVLLRLKRKQEEVNEEALRKSSVETGFSRSSTASVGALQRESQLPGQLPSHPEWMNVSNAYHYMKFAFGSYGWSWFVYGRFCSALRMLRPYLQCCACFRARQPFDAPKDNCCLCNTAALKAITNLTDDNLTYVTFHNKIFEVPFFVAIDHETKNVIIAIRGTLSLQDAITDLAAQCTEVKAPGLPENCLTHKGMEKSAQFVLKRLRESGALNDAFSRVNDYGLVITGHSLGAGAAVLLAALMRPEYPNIKCFAFSPPGGLCSKEFSQATQSFVMSVIVGDDLVPRLSLRSLHDLKSKIISSLERCRLPKYRVLAKGCCFMLFGISESSLQHANQSEAPNPVRPLLNSTSSYSYESVDDIRTPNSSDDDVQSNQLVLPRHTETAMFLPGRILHCTSKMQEDEDVVGVPGWECRWAEASEFRTLRISPSMMRHHLPPLVFSALKDLAHHEPPSIATI